MGIPACPDVSPKAEEHRAQGNTSPGPFQHSDLDLPPGKEAYKCNGSHPTPPKKKNKLKSVKETRLIGGNDILESG